jgi:hypothetical protein
MEEDIDTENMRLALLVMVLDPPPTHTNKTTKQITVEIHDQVALDQNAPGFRVPVVPDHLIFTSADRLVYQDEFKFFWQNHQDKVVFLIDFFFPTKSDQKYLKNLHHL